MGYSIQKEGEKQMYTLRTNQGSVLSPKASNTNLFLIQIKAQTWGRKEQ